MRVKMLASFSGGINLAPGDEHDFEQAEADRLIEAGFAEKIASTPAPEKRAPKAKE